MTVIELYERNNQRYSCIYSVLSDFKCNLSQKSFRRTLHQMSVLLMSQTVYVLYICVCVGFFNVLVK